MLKPTYLPMREALLFINEKGNIKLLEDVQAFIKTTKNELVYCK